MRFLFFLCRKRGNIMKYGIVWLRKDLRLIDQPALHHAVKECEYVIPVFILDRKEIRSMGARRGAFLLESLCCLDRNLRKKGSYLIIREGKVETELLKLIQETKAGALYWNREQEPLLRRQEINVSEQCAANDIETHNFSASMIHDVMEVLKDDGRPYTVFTPYYRRWSNMEKSPSLSSPKKIKTLKGIDSKTIPKIHDLKLKLDIALPSTDESNAQKILKNFLNNKIKHYHIARNIPSMSGTSQLSAYFNFGIISPRFAFNETWKFRKKMRNRKGPDAFLTEIAWRDFQRMILRHFPYVINQPFKDYKIRWENSGKHFKAWREGKTGFPIVDAGMRQLNQTGWMHNRLRMIVASFLTKDLLIDWRWGEKYFMEKLFDGDLASNNGGWQWSAGTGTDAQPFFRIFNPESQAQRFDPEEKFIKKYIPELHSKKYPRPIVDHALRRLKALKAFSR